VFECAIAAQGRMQFVVPILFGVGAIVVAIVLGLGGRALGIPETLTTGASVLITLCGLGVAVWYAAYGKGQLRMTPDALVVAPLWRSPIEVPLSVARTEQQLWIRRAPGSLRPVPVGPILELQGGGQSLSLGAVAPDLAPAAGPGTSVAVRFAPSFVLERGDLLEVARRLGVSLGSGR
jgi:hypothetical protein